MTLVSFVMLMLHRQCFCYFMFDIFLYFTFEYELFRKLAKFVNFLCVLNVCGMMDMVYLIIYCMYTVCLKKQLLVIRFSYCFVNLLYALLKYCMLISQRFYTLTYNSIQYT